MKQKVIVGLSGGVDSAVAIIMLQQQGYEVEAMFMRNWDSTINNDILGNPNSFEEVCPQEQDYMDAMAVSKKLNVKLHRIDFVEEYWNKVFSYFLDEYNKNRTPNPDILCNKEIKFKAFLEHANRLGADLIAMGHYARVRKGTKVELLRGKDQNKDQSYFLCQLNKEQLAKSLFPIGEMTKQEVREVAKKYGLNVAQKKDSTGVCFIGERDFKEFLKNYILAKPGDIVDKNGNKLGRHEGIMYYTIGQRKGLGIGGAGDAWFVVGKDPQKNHLIVGQGADQELLYSNRAIIRDVNWINDPFTGELTCSAKFRYRQKDNPVRLKWLEKDVLEVSYPERAKAVTPGQRHRDKAG